MPPPVASLQAVRVPRERLPSGPILAAPQAQARPALGIAYSPPYMPPPDGLTPARPARMPVFVSLATRAWHAVAQDFHILRVMDAPPPRVGMPRGKQLPWVERANIHAPIADAYGSQFGHVPALEPNQAFTPVPLAGMP